ncbi:alpha-glucosidase [uncultured Eubacterium sp.]|uniref:glycoside hydrolase family 13 protein n=1 Tax=uncultured Eubacterium sp. TaxID=165185 RepID=UPI0025F1CA57|nr:alpha-glucosidase [uncultured Eubacterium sp.]MCI6538301.1 alpha-glucosidase [Lachnospiraceae bacterium]
MSKKTNTEWWKKSVVYQVYPKSFQDSNGDGYGDLNGIRQRLPYLKELGIDVIWLNPIYASPQVDNGYDISDYRMIEPTFGTMEDFDALLAEAHAMGLKIILDLVVNHTSDQHKWFLEAKKSKDNPYHDYYIWKDEVPNNWGSSFGGSTWEYVPEVGQYYLHLFAKEQPDLNWDNPKVRQEVYDILRFWLDKGIDGFRMDVITLISKDPAYPDGPVIQNKAYGSYYAGCATGPHVHEYLQEMNREVLSKYDIMTVGEAPHTSADQAMDYTGADRGELNMVFHFDHMHLDYDENGKYARNRVKLTDLKKVFTEWDEKMRACGGWNSLYWSNHDQARAVTRFGDESPEYRVISAKMLGTALHMLQGTPYIYEGEEIGMTNAFFDKIEDYRDVEALDIFKDFTGRKGFSAKDTLELLRLKSRDNSRTPMQWSTEKNAGFTDGEPWIAVNENYKTINAEAAVKDPESVFFYYKKLVQLRHEMPVITDGVYKLLDADNEKVYTYLRKSEDETLLVICNFTKETIDYPVGDFVNADQGTLLISNYDDAPQQYADAIELKPYGAYVYEIK